ncbi:hypothetical protein ADK65_16300 [Streptomyces sp. NRRL B-1140]|nr:hypothetical protein ADK65_16300 [Streptomyces sp. NRRL B-1140]
MAGELLQALGETEACETDLRVWRGRVVQHLAGEAEHVGAGDELDGFQVVGETGEIAAVVVGHQVAGFAFWGQPGQKPGWCLTGGAFHQAAAFARQHQPASGREGAVELREHGRQPLRRGVVGGVVRQDAAEFAAADLQCGHRADGEAEFRVRRPGQFDHSRRHVHAEHRHSEGGQVCRHLAGAAAQIGDRPEGSREFGEGGQQAAGDRVQLGRFRHESGVGGGDGVVGLADGGDVGGLGHPAKVGDGTDTPRQRGSWHLPKGFRQMHTIFRQKGATSWHAWD